MQHDACSGAAERMAHRDRAAVDVDPCRVDPSARVEATPTAANASLISTRSRSVGSMPSSLHALAIALAGCRCSVESGPATTPCAPISQSQDNPPDCALSLVVMTTADAPSEIGD